MQNNQQIAVFGGGGFLGRHLIRELTKENYRIKVATRNPYLKGYLRPLGNPGQIELIKTNIFNAEDVKQILQNCDYAIKSKLISNHKFNEKKNISKIIEILKSKKIVSVVSDAGTPSISDPGSIIVRECVKEKINIYPIPGPSAVTSAISISGFSEKYYFYGFFPEKNKTLTEDLSVLSDLNCSIVFFVSPRKINKAINPIKNFFSGRKILICREMSKFYEEYLRTSVDNLKMYEKAPKGELTIVISEKNLNKNKSNNLNESDKKKIKSMLKNLSVRDITDLISKEKKVPKKEIYDYCLKIKNEK